jgi:MFS family permease
VVTGIGAGIVSPVLPAVAAISVPPTRAGTAAAAANAARQLGLTIGVALCGAVAQSGSAGSDTSASGLAGALIVAGLVAICGGAVSFALLRAADRTVYERA